MCDAVCCPWLRGERSERSLTEESERTLLPSEARSEGAEQVSPQGSSHAPESSRKLDLPVCSSNTQAAQGAHDVMIPPQLP